MCAARLIRRLLIIRTSTRQAGSEATGCAGASAAAIAMQTQGQAIHRPAHATQQQVRLGGWWPPTRRRIWSARRRGTKMPASWPCLFTRGVGLAYKKLRARIRRPRSLASWTDPHLGSRPPHPPVTPIFIFGREPILSSLLNQRRMMAMACRSSSTSSKI